MADGPSSNGNGDSSTPPEGGIWRGLRTLIFGDEGADTLRQRIEESITEHEAEGGVEIKGDLSPIERKMLRNLLHFGERDAGDVGVPRADIIAISEDAGFDELVALFDEAGHSRIPVFRDNLDSVTGMIHVKDVFRLLAADEPRPARVGDVTPRQPLFVPPSMGVLDLLAMMQARRTHLAIVFDEHGGTEGLITFEDLVEEIVGEIDDEHDEETTALFTPLDGGGWDADARAELEDVAEAIDARLAEVEEDVDTLGGLAFVLAGEVPKVGDVLDHPSGWRLEVVEADAKRVSRLRLHPPERMAIPED